MKRGSGGEANTLGPGARIAPFALLPYGGGPPARWSPGQTTILSFCALWCETWRAQSARLREVRSALVGLPISYRTISVDGRWAEKFHDDPGAPPILLDAGGRLSARLGVRAVPHTFVVDKNGVVRFVAQGITRTETLLPLLRALATGESLSPTDSAGGAVYLTFADFPSASRDEDETLLDVLRRAETPATFFCRADRLTARAGQAVTARAVREGHALQIDAASADPNQTARALSLAGAPATLVLSPDASAVVGWAGHTLGFRPSLLCPFDDLRPGIAELSRRVLYGAHPGSVVLLHAGVRSTCDALPDLIASLRRRGLRFKRLI